MIATEQLTERQARVKSSRSMNEWAVSGLAEISYNVSHHVEVIGLYWKFMPGGKLKDIFRIYRENQQMWKAKMLRAFDDIARNAEGEAGKTIGETMRRDLGGEEILAYMDASADLQRFHDLEHGADIIKLLSQVEDISAISDNLRLIIQNQINKEAL
jgi:hypothetical protein